MPNMMVLKQAQTRLDRFMDEIRSPGHGAEVSYTKSCRCKYKIEVNDSRGRQVFFILNRKELSSDDTLRGELQMAFFRLECKG